MAAADAPITVEEILTLSSIGINEQFITFANVTMESEKFICVRVTFPQNSVVIVDMNMPLQPLRRAITADSVIMNPNARILALKASLPGTTQDHLQVFNIDTKAKLKSCQMPGQVSFWKWITPELLGLVTQASVYHWSIEGDSEPVKMFDRTANLANNQIINYKCDSSEKWLVLIGIAPVSPERRQLVKGNMQLFSVDQQRSQALEAHAASFASFKVPGNENPSILISFATKSINAGQVTSKLHVIELGAKPGKAAFTEKQADLLFPPDFADDFPVAMQISHRYSLIHVITKLGLLYVYDLETAAAVYRNRISSDPIFLTSEASSGEGFYAINRRGQVLLATVNISTIVSFISVQLNNPELAVDLLKRGNLPDVENLVGYTPPDYLSLLQTILRSDPRGAVKFALVMSRMEGGCPVDYNIITDLFVERKLIREATTFLLDVLKPNLPEHAFLQTRVLEINLLTYPNVVEAILENGMFSHYDRHRISQLCKEAGLYVELFRGI